MVRVGREGKREMKLIHTNSHLELPLLVTSKQKMHVSVGEKGKGRREGYLTNFGRMKAQVLTGREYFGAIYPSLYTPLLIASF